VSTFSVKVDISRFDSTMNAFAYSADEAARPAAQAAAQVLYDEVKRNVARIKPKTGNLARGIYQAYSRDNSAQGRATYHVSWNAKKAPHGHLVEFGHLQRYEITYDPKTRRFTTHKDRPLAGGPKQVAARPFIRPALSKAEAAITAARAEFMRRMGLTP
jgi:HK97 gp10 family phage protein